jgi:hypothetical protein
MLFILYTKDRALPLNASVGTQENFVQSKEKTTNGNDFYMDAQYAVRRLKTLKPLAL